MNFSFQAKWIVVLFGLSPLTQSWAQPSSGDVFREYRYECTMDLGGTKPTCSAGSALRVGPCVEPFCTDKGTCHTCHDIRLANDVDLNHATRAEVVIEKVLCHDSTVGLRIQFNSNSWIPIPEAPGIPTPQSDYQHHIYPVVEVPLGHLQSGTNVFQMRVDHSGWWPQNLINGVHLRIYYDPGQKAHAAGQISSPATGATVGMSVDLTAEITAGTANKVEYIGYYDQVNWQGDGVYRQWHYIYDHAKFIMHLGTSQSEPFRVSWDTSWVPDQSQPMKIRARITDSNNITFVTDEVANLSLNRGGDYSVELCKPYDIPIKWVTRKGDHTEKFDLTGNLAKAKAAQMVWCSWSPCYANGILINGTQIVVKEGDWPCYHTFHHRYDFADVGMLKSGTNTLTTKLIPGGGKHGMEVNFPGIMLLVQYGEPGAVISPSILLLLLQ